MCKAKDFVGNACKFPFESVKDRLQELDYSNLLENLYVIFKQFIVVDN